MSAIQPPQQVSPDGREIWDWASALSKHRQTVARIRELRAGIAKIGSRCGDCAKWMCSSECPREKNVNGRNRGPSCDAPKCSQYVETKHSTELRKELETELAAMAPATPAEGKAAL